MEEKFITMFTKVHHVDTLISKTNAPVEKQNIPNHLFNTTVWQQVIAPGSSHFTTYTNILSGQTILPHPVANSGSAVIHLPWLLQKLEG